MITVVLGKEIRAIDFFKIAKASGHPVDDVIKAWDGREYISKDKLKDYLKRWRDRIKNGTAIPWEEVVGKEMNDGK